MTDMLNYGAAAQQYFNYNTAALATDGVSLGTASSVTLAQNADNYNHVPAFHSSNLTLEERIDFSMYFWTSRLNSTAYTYVVRTGAGAPITSGSGTFVVLDDDGYLSEAKIDGLNLSAMEDAVIVVTFDDLDGNTYEAKDSLANYLYRNQGLDLDDAPATYAEDGTLVADATGKNDASDLYAKVMAFAHAASAYNYSTQG